MSDEELDILQEIMNIAFGKATAELAELIDIRRKAERSRDEGHTDDRITDVSAE